MRRTKENGITLIALIITVIIMLVLAGVSLNALVGDNGIITNAREASTLTKLSTYKEEVEMNLIKYVPEDDLQRKNNISALGENIKKYIPSLKEEDLSDFAVICGELYYLGADDEMKVSAKQVGINILEESSSKEEAIAELETRAMEGIIRQTGNVSSVENTKYGELLKSRKGNSTDWRIITEISKVDGSVNHVYGDDYYYIGKGTTIEDLGALNSGYIVDYEKQKIINIDYSENFSYTYSDIDSVLGVTDKLVFYIDGKNMEADENGNYNWGEGVYLRSDTKSDEDIHPSDYIANNTFTFDGSNFIEISSENTFDFSKGITFECFGSDLSGYKSGNDHEYGAFFSTYSQVFPTDNPKVFCNTRFALRRMSGSGYRFFYSLNTNKSEFDNGYSE
ncbi:MAG: hypothetical protein IJ867_01380, partial [Clostridia bacterium]|nr:hypothetical protein [Clostridia bacterium]